LRVRFITIDGIRTRCLLAGRDDAYPILLLHGYGGSADIWIRNIDALASDFRVIAPDLIGSGFTEPVEIGDDAPTPHAVKHLVALVDRLGLERFCASGTSFGGLVAAQLFLALPRRVDKLVINGSGSCFNTDEQLVKGLERVWDSFHPLLENPSIEGCRESMARLCFDPRAVPEEILPVMATAYAQPWMLDSWKRGLRGLMDLEATRPHRVFDRLQELRVESLLVWGREDKGAIYESAVTGVRRMPKAQLITFERCGHKPMFEHPDSYNELIRDFLRHGLPIARETIG
jgi:2-hydroxy-6-oxonona-2,4-dienedioate hydrolase